MFVVEYVGLIGEAVAIFGGVVGGDTDHFGGEHRFFFVGEGDEESFSGAPGVKDGPGGGGAGFGGVGGVVFDVVGGVVVGGVVFEVGFKFVGGQCWRCSLRLRGGAWWL